MSWELIKLSDILDLQNGFAFNSSDYIEKSNTLNCRMSNIRPGGDFNLDYNPRYLPDSFAISHSQYLLDDGDLIVAMTDLANDPKILGVPALVKTGGKSVLLNQRVGKLVIKDRSKVNIPFLKYALNRSEVQLYYSKFSSGGLQINLGKNDLLSYKFSLPPLATQKRIAEILDKADTLRKKDKQLLQYYDELAQSLFIDMFGDPVRNEKGWPLGTIRKLCIEVKYGTSKPALDGGEHIYLRMNNITYSGDWDFTNLKYINLDSSEMVKYSLQRGDLVFNRTNSKELVGKTAVYTRDEQMTIAGYLIRVRTNKRANPQYISAFLNSKYGKAVLKNLCKNIIGMANINAQELQNIEILIPPIILQNQFAQQIQNIEQQKEKLKAQMQESENLFQALLQRAFHSGLN